MAFTASSAHAHTDRSFTQVTSSRFYTLAGATPLPYVAPFPTLNMSSVKQLAYAGENGGAGATIALAADNSLHLLGGKYGTHSLGVTLPPESMLGVTFKQGVTLSILVLTCSADGCLSWTCATTAKVPTCTPILTTGGTRALGKVHVLEMGSDGVAWLATTRAGLLQLSGWADPSQPVNWQSFGDSVVGNVTAIAYLAYIDPGTSEPLLAVSTNLAVYHTYNSSSRNFKRHELIGSAIDAPPTALAYGTEPTPNGGEFVLWIGHEWCTCGDSPLCRHENTHTRVRTQLSYMHFDARSDWPGL